MEFENIEMMENIETTTNVVEEVVQKNGSNLKKPGVIALIVTVATAAVVGGIALTKRKRSKKAKEEETENDGNIDHECDDDCISDGENE